MLNTIDNHGFSSARHGLSTARMIMLRGSQPSTDIFRSKTQNQCEKPNGTVTSECRVCLFVMHRAKQFEDRKGPLPTRMCHAQPILKRARKLEEIKCKKYLLVEEQEEELQIRKYCPVQVDPARR
jgi:hypothetical protein